MKLTKKQAITLAAYITVLFSAVLLMILEWAGVFTLCAHPIFMLLMILSGGFGIIQIVLAIIDKSPFRFMLAAFLLVYLVSYCLIDFLSLKWWLILIIDIAVVFFIVAASLFTAGDKTEGIALNAAPDYKDYKERNAERDAKEAEEEENLVLPEIKSFKDSDKKD